jgi:hypothetical protein
MNIKMTLLLSLLSMTKSIVLAITTVMPLPLPTYQKRLVMVMAESNSHSSLMLDAASTTLVEEIGSLPALERITTHFYNTAFLDDTLDKFIGSYDDPHANRFARWIHQKLTGTGRIFSLEGINGILPHYIHSCWLIKLSNTNREREP